MTSWIHGTVSKKSTYRSGYFQETPEGVFMNKTKEATVVSAFYEMPSKYNLNTYKVWMRYFLTSTPCHLVFFCEDSMREFIEECRADYMDRTRIIILPREEWVANKRFSKSFWDKQFAMDPEKDVHRSSDLYKVWYEKKEFVKRAIELNPFEHDDFIWMDAGSVRSESFAQLLTNFPQASRIPTNRILLLNVQPFSKQDNLINNFEKNVTIQGLGGRARIGGTVMAGSVRMWNQFSKVFDSVFDKYVSANLFVGKDQTILATLVLENRRLISLVEPKPLFGDPWFNLILYLGVNKKLFEMFNDASKSSVRKSYDDLLLIL
jgi:hypothetical protein